MEIFDDESEKDDDYHLEPDDDLGLRPDTLIRKETNPRNWKQIINAKRKEARTLFLTQRVVDRAQPSFKEYTIYHKTLPGFGMRMRPTGYKNYILLYKKLGGGTGKYNIGTRLRYSPT